jgi:hypothetical protein
MEVHYGEGLAGGVAARREPAHHATLKESGERLPVSFLDEGFQAYYATPLVVKERAVGVLETFFRLPVTQTPEWLDFLDTLGGQAAIAVDTSTLLLDLQRTNRQLSQAYSATLEGWSKALELRDRETQGHTQRVTDLTLHVARKAGFEEDELIHIYHGALLHDIGKMAIPDSILLKPGPLDPEEWQVMRLHPVYAYELLSGIPFLRPALDIPHYHHERWDGNGYPDGLQAEQIPLAARLFAIVDVWDALLSDRPYREAWSAGRVEDYLNQESGKHFDPQVVNVFFDSLSSLPALLPYNPNCYPPDRTKTGCDWAHRAQSHPVFT